MIEIKHTFTCNICGDTAEESHVWPTGWELPRPNIPEGWTTILERDFLVCPKHEVKRILFVDGKEVNL
jgi:hypothetical protein